jgi:hypothetical protein
LEGGEKVRPANIGDLVRNGDRYLEVDGFQIIDEHKYIILSSSAGELKVPVSRVRWDEKKKCFVLQPKNIIETPAV